MPAPLNSALITLEMPQQVLKIRITARGDPETLRRILRKCTSHRRSITYTRPGTFAGNLVRHYVGLGQDILSIEPEQVTAGPLDHIYTITLGESPRIAIKVPNEDSVVRLLFEFMGPEWVRRTPEGYSGRRRGRRAALYKRPEIIAKLGKGPKVAAEDMPRYAGQAPPDEINDCVIRLGPRRYGIYFPDDPPENERE